MNTQNKPERSARAMLFAPILAAVLLSAGVSPAQAHAPDQSYVFLSVYDDSLDARIEITIPDVNAAVGLNLSEDRLLTRDDIEVYLPQIKSYLAERISLAPNGQPRPLIFDEVDLTEAPLPQYLHLKFSFRDLAGPLEYVDTNYNVLFDTRSSHRAFLVIEHNWKTGTFSNEARISLSYSLGDTRKTLTIDGSLMQGFRAMVGEGTHHIWIGIDHVLFLIALLLPSVMHGERANRQPVAGFRPAFVYVVKIVTIFTVAHTITLSAAALGALSMPSRLVESVIALSIAVAALEILFPVFGKRIWWVVFAFGLFHGFGFASVLADIGIVGDYLALTLLGFNVGVELGQIAIVAAVFPLLYLLRRTRFYNFAVLRAGALALIATSLYWFVERGFGIDIPGGRILNRTIEILT